MKAKQMFKYSLLVVVFLTTLLSYSNNLTKGKYKRTKTINKEFSVTHNNTVDITNKYGDITITTWNEDKVSIEVIITVKSNDKELADKKFNNITITFNQDRKHVFAETNINATRFKWSFFKGNTSIDTQIDYYIKMPVYNHVNLKNNYGSIFIDVLDGKCKINCNYGSIRIGELNNKTNTIFMDYGTSSTIEFINSGKINTDYSTLSLGEVNDLEVVADYSNLEVEDAKHLTYNNDYGSLKIKKVQVLEGDGDYLTLKVDELEKSLTVSSDYGAIKVYKIKKGFTNVFIDAKYTGIKLGIDATANLNFNLKTSYAGISFEELNVHFNYKEINMSSKIYKGIINQEKNNSMLKVTSSYSNIKLFEAEK